MTPDTSAFGYGESTLPNPFPVEYSMISSSTEPLQADKCGRYLLNRAIDYIKNGSFTHGNLAEAKRLLEFYLLNVQHTFMWGTGSLQKYNAAYGSQWYPPYMQDSFERAIFAAAAFGLDPSYEPLHNLLTLMAQRVNAFLTNTGVFTYGNGQTEGGIATHKDDNSYTKWIYYTKGATNYGAKGGYHLRIIGPGLWARKLLNWGLEYPMNDVLYYSGWGPGNNRYGCDYTSEGLGGGWNLFYSHNEIHGMMFMWCAGGYEDTLVMRYSRRNYLWFIDTTNSTTISDTTISNFQGVYCQNRFISEPRNISIIENNNKTWTINYDTVTGADHYKLYHQPKKGEKAISVQNNISSSPYTLTKSTIKPFGSGVLRLVAVDSSGNESSLSDLMLIEVKPDTLHKYNIITY
jgi:hypothetical protein